MKVQGLKRQPPRLICWVTIIRVIVVVLAMIRFVKPADEGRQPFTMFSTSAPLRSTEIHNLSTKVEKRAPDSQKFLNLTVRFAAKSMPVTTENSGVIGEKHMSPWSQLRARRNETHLPVEIKFAKKEMDSIKLLDDRLTFTCREKCGDDTVFPCSCASPCVLYDSCCENITIDCPEIVKDSQTLYSSLLDSQVACGNEGVYKIFSCPGPGNSGEANEKISRKIPMSNKEIEKAMLKTPITDEESGITFVSKSVYDCFDDMTSRNVLRWGIYLDQNFAGGTDFVATVNSYSLMYNESILEAHRCYASAISSCPKETPNSISPSEFSYYSDNCNKFHGVVYSNTSKQVYINRFCAYCNEGRHKGLSLKMKYKEKIKQIDFVTVVSLNDFGEVMVNLDERGYSAHVSVAWTRAVCPDFNSFVSIRSDPLICQYKCMNFTSIKNIDGMCKFNILAVLAVSTQDLGVTHSEWSLFEKKFAQFFSCSLGQMLTLGNWIYVNFDIPNIFLQFDERTNKTLFLFELHIYSIDQNTFNKVFAFHDSEVAYNIRQLAIIVKALKEHRPYIDLSLDIDNQTALTPLEALQTFKSKDLKSELGIDLDAEMTRLRGPIVEKDNVTTFCVSKLLSHGSRPTVLCMEDPMYDKDRAEIEKFLLSTCFDNFGRELTVTRSNSKTLYRANTVIWTLVIVWATMVIQASLVGTHASKDFIQIQIL